MKMMNANSPGIMAGCNFRKASIANSNIKNNAKACRKDVQRPPGAHRPDGCGVCVVQESCPASDRNILKQHSSALKA